MREDLVTLAIIAGGQARRLGGVPKGLLLREEQPLIAHLLAMGPRFAEVILVASDPAAYRGFEVRSVPDVVQDRGAPGGVHAALVQAGTPWVVAVAVDMPFVTAAVVDRLLAERGPEVDAVGFEVEGRLEPLLACYRTAIAGVWGRALAEGEGRSFRQLWAAVRTRILPEAALAVVDPGLKAIRSVNTPEDARTLGVVVPTGR